MVKIVRAPTGLGFNANRSKDRARLGILLLIGCLASFALRLIGAVARDRQLELRFQSNSRRSRPVLSIITLARFVLRAGNIKLRQSELHIAMRSLRYHHPALQI